MWYGEFRATRYSGIFFRQTMHHSFILVSWFCFLFVPRVDNPMIGWQIITEGGHRFFMREKDSTLTFAPNGDAPVAEVSFFDFGRARPGKRVR